MTTDSQGRFAFVATSSDEGSTEFYATYSVTGDTSAQGHITWQQPVFYVVPDQETVLATVSLPACCGSLAHRAPCCGTATIVASIFQMLGISCRENCLPGSSQHVCDIDQPMSPC